MPHCQYELLDKEMRMQYRTRLHGFGPEVVNRMNGKMHSKGGQTTLIYDINWHYPRGYIHHHKLQLKPMGFTAQGPSEIFDIVKTIDVQTVDAPQSSWEEVVIQNPTEVGTLKFRMKNVSPQPPHIVADNHFSGEEVMTLLGRKGYSATMMNRRDRFPEGFKPYLHHEGVKSGCPKERAMRLENPIVAIKQVPAVEDEDGSTKAKVYTRTLVSFQLTGPKNVCGVNNLPSVNLYVSERVHGKGAATKVWGIEQNKARETYLRHYYGINNLDHMIENCGNRFISWKYWHAPYLHAQSMGAIAAYDMHQECCNGELDAS